MAKIKFFLIGSTGRMGSTFKQLLETDQEMSSQYELVAEAHQDLSPSIEEIKKSGAQVAIDFSQPVSTLKFAPLLAELKIPHLIATTGFKEEELNQLKSIYSSNTWLLAPNTSFGIHLMKKAIALLLKDLSQKGFVAYLYDTHHRFKKDAPSGTALTLAESVKQADPKISLDIHAARGGNEIGEHRLVLLGPGEKLELTHQASDRNLFAYGAFELAKKLMKLPAKGQAYSVADVFNS